MFKRLLLLTAMLLLPVGALAGEDTSATDPAAAPQAQATPAEASSAGLGPQAVGPDAGSPTGSGTTLQPAGQAPLQSTTGDSNGLTAPQSALQAPVTTDEQLKVLQGEADGRPQDPNEPKDNIWTFLGIAFVTFAIAWGSVVWRERRRSAQREKPVVSDGTEPGADVDEAEAGDTEGQEDDATEKTEEEPDAEPEKPAGSGAQDTPEPVAPKSAEPAPKRSRKRRKKH